MNCSCTLELLHWIMVWRKGSVFNIFYCSSLRFSNDPGRIREIGRDKDPVLWSRDTDPEIRSRDTDPELRSRDTDPELRSRDTDPDLWSRNTDPFLGSRDTDRDL